MDATTFLSIAKTGLNLEEAGEKLLLPQRELGPLVAIPVVDATHLQINALVENVPLGETHTGYFSDPVFQALEVINRPDVEGVQIRLWGKELNIPLEDGGPFSELGVKNVIEMALAPSVEQFMRIRLEELSPGHGGELERLITAGPFFPTPTVFAVRVQDAGRVFQELEKQAGQQSDTHFFAAKRIDYQVGNQYVPGRVCELPLVGGISNWIFKQKLDLEMEGADWGKVADDVFMVVSIAAIPLAPATGGLSMLGWVGANAAFGSISKGCVSYLTDANPETALREAGKGALLGAVGGAAGVAAAAKVAPLFTNKLVAAATSGGVVGGATSGTDAFMRSIEKGEDLQQAAKEVAMATLVGGTLGGAVGAGSFSLVKVAASFKETIADRVEQSITAKAETFEKFRSSVEPLLPEKGYFHGGDLRHHAKELDSRMDDFAAHLYRTDEGFARHVEKFGVNLAKAQLANDQALVEKLQRQIRQGLAGEFAEAKVRTMFAPFFEKITSQQRVQDGATIIDMVLQGARHPLAIKGHRFVETGGSMPVEVKAGSEGYFQSELDSGHLLKQVAGHGEFGRGLVITTRDVGDAIMKTGNAREMLKEAGSAPFRLLPHKAELDEVLRRLVEEVSRKYP